MGKTGTLFDDTLLFTILFHQKQVKGGTGKVIKKYVKFL